MTIPDPRLLDLTAFDGSDGWRVQHNGSDLHTLRLALDLQLDAMLLALGAAAHADTRAGQDGGVIPWRRWLSEDLELARTLAAALVEGEAAPVPGIGGGLAHSGVETSLEQLVARYSAMEQLLCRVLERPRRAEGWRGAAGDALGRCRARLDELHHHRREVISAGSARVAFLPGELLG